MRRSTRTGRPCFLLMKLTCGTIFLLCCTLIASSSQRWLAYLQQHALLLALCSKHRSSGSTLKTFLQSTLCRSVAFLRLVMRFSQAQH